METALIRATGTFLLTGGWLLLLFSGYHLGGAAHLLFIAALALFPWRWLQRRRDG